MSKKAVLDNYLRTQKYCPEGLNMGPPKNQKMKQKKKKTENNYELLTCIILL